MALPQELIDRWDSFLQKMETRFHKNLKDAEEICIEQMRETDYDYNIVLGTWQGIKSQIQNFINKIGDTWEKKVQPQMREQINNWSKESSKGQNLNHKLQEKLDRFEIMLVGKLSKIFYDHAIQIANQDFYCTQCNAPIQIVKDIFRAQYISCQFCNTVNTFEPETKFLQIGHNVIDCIAAVNCIKEYDAMKKALTEINTQIPPIEDIYWNEYKTSYFRYYETYFKERIKLKTNAKDRYNEDMLRKIKEYNAFEKTSRYNKYGDN